MGHPLKHCIGCSGTGSVSSGVTCGHCGGRGLVKDETLDLIQKGTRHAPRGRLTRVAPGRLPAMVRLAQVGLGALAGYATYLAYEPQKYAVLIGFAAYLAVVVTIHVLYRVVTQPFQAILLVGIVYGIDQYLFSGAGRVWLMGDGRTMAASLLGN